MLQSKWLWLVVGLVSVACSEGKGTTQNQKGVPAAAATQAAANAGRCDIIQKGKDGKEICYVEVKDGPAPAGPAPAGPAPQPQPAPGPGTNEPPAPALVGKITEDDNELEGFAPKAAYAEVIEAGGIKTFMLVVTEAAATKDQFEKRVTKWECRKCEGDKDPNCKTTTTATPKTLAIMLMQAAVESASGAPKTDEYKTTGSATADAAVGMTVSYGTKLGFGILTFDVKPDAVDDDVKAVLDLTIDSKKYKATIETVFYKRPTSVSPPTTCKVGKGEYLKATFE